MKIVYTKHALKKFKHPSIIKLQVKRKNVEETLSSPDSKSEDEKAYTISVLKKLDERHNLRVIYKEVSDIITIITFHPARRGRYEQD